MNYDRNEHQKKLTIHPSLYQVKRMKAGITSVREETEDMFLCSRTFMEKSDVSKYLMFWVEKIDIEVNELFT